MSARFPRAARLSPVLGALCLGSVCLGSIACAPPAESVTEGPVAASLRLAADESGVPRDLLVALAVEESGLGLAPRRSYHEDDHVPIAGHLQLRHGAFDSLERAAQIAGLSEATLVEDTALSTRIGARVLAELGAQTGADDQLTSWAPALEIMGGLGGAERSAYAHRVLAHLVDGGRYPAYAGEAVTLAAHGDLALPGVARQALGGPSEFPGATWVQTSCTNKCNIGRDGVLVDTILIHDTEAGWNSSLATLQSDPGKSVHYLIDADGSRVVQFRPEADTAWHSGNAVYNARSVGIEHVGFIDDAAGFSPALYAVSASLVASIRGRHAVPLDRQHIIGHYQVPDGGQIAAASAPCDLPLLSCLSSSHFGGSNNHRDPGTRWQWCQYMQRLGGDCACNDTYANFNCTTDRTEAVRCVNGSVEIRSCASPCEVQPIGVPDVCEPLATVPPSRFIERVSRRAIATLVQEPSASRPGDVPGDAPAATSSNPPSAACAFSGAPRTGGPLGPLAVLASLGFASLRRTRRRAS